MSFQNEKTVETKTCKQCQSKFDVTDKDLEFYEKVSPVFTTCHPEFVSEGQSQIIKNLGNGKIKYLIPTPTLCPECRQQRRLSFRNERKLYKRKCGATGENIISIYSPDKHFNVYNQEFWWSDKWNPLEYGKDYDFSKSFFEQFKDLALVQPRISLHNVNNEDSFFINQCGYSKKCYLSFNTDYSENCYYCNNVFKSNNCLDLYNADNCELCYNSVDIKNSYKIKDSQICKNCSDIYYGYNLVNCKNCFGCINLSNKEHYIFNKKYSKQDYYDKVNELLNNKSNSLDIYNNLKLQLAHKYININNSESILGDNVFDSKNMKYCFDCFSDENLAYCCIVSDGKNIYDFDIGGYYSELNYEVVSSGDNNNNICFNSNIWGHSNNIYYCDIVINSSNLFGCIGIRNKSYCILNKQYTKEQYEELVPKIIEHMMKTGEWGEFFPSSISPFGYNETVAQEFFPLSREDVLYPIIPAKAGIYNNSLSSGTNVKNPFSNANNKNVNLRNSSLLSEGQTINTFLHGPIFNWSDYEVPFPKVDKIIKANILPINIKDIPDDILNWAIECEVTKKPFRIITQELEFYRKHNLPIPRRHPDQRHLDRMALRNPRKLYDRKCDKCKKEIGTTYSPDRKEIVYCEECYNKEIY
ncbi:MAG: hypothetical protein PHN31_02285 [Candidatus Gracilibacteria bacterium]|nr:hypothetical protein [Candidatus Gracilibacteria bacterium]